MTTGHREDGQLDHPWLGFDQRCGTRRTRNKEIEYINKRMIEVMGPEVPAR